MFEFTTMILAAVRSRNWALVQALAIAAMLELTEWALEAVDRFDRRVAEIFGRNPELHSRMDRAQGNLASLVIGIVIAGIIVVAVAIPVINDTVSSSNASGTTLTILNLLDLFFALLILVAIAAPLMRRA